MDRIVPESALMKAGFEVRDEGSAEGPRRYRVLKIENREVRFVEVAHGQYIFDGERRVYVNNEKEVKQ